MKPRRVLHVLNGAAGGAFLSTLTLIEALAREGVESSAVCHALGSPDSRQRLMDATRGRTEFRPLFWWNKKIRAARWKRPLLDTYQLALTGGTLASTWSVARAARAFDADLIHTNSLVIREGAHAARLLAAPHVWHLREMLGPGEPFQLTRSGPRLGRYIAKRASVVVATSKAAAERLEGCPGIRVVYNGVDVAEFRLERAPHDRVTIAMIGNVTARWKRHDLFLRAMQSLPNESNVAIQVYGDPPVANEPYSNQLLELANHPNLKGRFDWMGSKPATKIMRSIDILVHPASGESFGRTVVEAMAAGIPVVGVRAGGVAELIDHETTGLLVTADDAHAMSTAVSRLVADASLRERLGARGRERASSHFSVEAYVSGILDAYDAALELPLARGLPI